jgi:hypothetical protein
MSYTAKKWTPEEVTKAVGFFKKGKDYKYISDKIDGRSPFAIQCKLESYVLEKINSGMTYANLAKDFNKSEAELKKMYESQFNRNASKNGGATTTIATSSSPSFTASPNSAYGMINRIMTPFIEYHENLEKLLKLKENETISSKTYKEIKKILDSNAIEPEKFITQLRMTSETKRINPVKSDSKTDESDDSDKSDDSDDSDDANDADDAKESEEKPVRGEKVLPRKRLF